MRKGKEKEKSHEEESSEAKVTELPLAKKKKKGKRKRKIKRVFHCPDCKTLWWEKFSNDELAVAICKNCKEEYEAVPLEDPDPVGIGKFKCACGHTFTSKARYGTDCYCYVCQNVLRPDKITRFREIRGKSNRKHACSDCDYGKQDPCPNSKPRVPFSKLHKKEADNNHSVTADLAESLNSLKLK